MAVWSHSRAVGTHTRPAIPHRTHRPAGDLHHANSGGQATATSHDDRHRAPWRHPSRLSVCTRLPEAHSEALEWRGAPPRMARQAAARTRPPNSVAARVSCGVGGLQTRQVVRDARRRRRGADTTKRTTTIGRYSSARPPARSAAAPSGSRPQNQMNLGPVVNHRPSTPRRAP